MSRIQLDIPQIKNRLRRARWSLDISQREAAEQAGISKSVLEKYESRENERIPNTRQLFRLVEVYGVSADWILAGDRHEYAEPARNAAAGEQAASSASC